MSDIYSGGNEATALAAIGAALDTFINFNAAGELVLDTQGLEEYLRDEAADAAANEFVAPATAETAAAAAATAPWGSFVAALNAAIGVTAWRGRSDWPTTTSALAGGNFVASVRAAMDLCKRESDYVALYFADIDSMLEQGLIDTFDGFDIGSSLPPVVERQMQTRVAFYTYVTDWGWESAPSPPSELAELDQNDTATYEAAAPPSGRDITKIRWYRGRTTNFADDNGFVAEVAYDSGDPATLQYLDALKDEQLDEPCPSVTWLEPPATLVGLVEGANAGMGGFIEGSNTACFSENEEGYAWPEEYRKTTAWPIVGMGRFGQTYVVLTRGQPYYCTGPDSASLDKKMQDSNQACVSRRSIVSTEVGVFFASPDGICIADQAGVRVITDEIWDREAWQALTPSAIFATEHERCYLFSNGSATYSINVKDGKLVQITGMSPSAFYRDLVTDTLYFAQGTALKSAFTAATKRTAVWKGKKMALQKPSNMGWLQVDSDFEAPITVKLYRDGTLTDTKSVSTRRPVRLSSKHAIEHEVQVEGATGGTRVLITSTSEELRQL